MSGICDGRVVIVTGAGRGLGAAHALAFGREGARVVVNDVGVSLDGQGRDSTPADEVVSRIRDEGGEAIANHDDVSDYDGAGRLVAVALDSFGHLDVLVNNAGIVRDRMFVNLTSDEWDAVIRVHLRGHFCTARHAAAYWRDRTKSGERVDARIVNTSSGAGLMGSVGQSNYVAAKAAIAGLTVIQAAELARYGVTANALAPSARTRMTEEAFPDTMAVVTDGFDAMAPENISPLVVWLGSSESADVTGRVFEIEGGKISVCDGWQHGTPVDKGARWESAEVGDAVRKLLAAAPTPAPVYGAG